MTFISDLMAAACVVEDTRLSRDLQWEISSGYENADTTMHEMGATGYAPDTSEVSSSYAVSTIACSLSEREFQPHYGSDADTVRAWFTSQGLRY